MIDATEDLRIRAIRPLVPPGVLHEELPMTEAAAHTITRGRQMIEAALEGEDGRLLVVVGHCSIHDVDAAREYADRLREAVERYPSLLIAMRCYFEKPRTSVGWKGLINDPRMDGSFRINEGLRMARKLLIHIAEIGLPTATEWLDSTVPQHLADAVAWGAIGARTTESQIHRELASGLSMPVGFKNATDGNVQPAIDALKAARQPHWFPGTTKDGMAAILQTTGNESVHVVLRGGSRTGPNYSELHVCNAAAILERDGLPARLMVDCSHGNSSKDHLRQLEVAEDVASQRRQEGSPIFAAMIESNLVEGRQDAAPGKGLVHGQSITDACLGWEQTETALAVLNQ
ncbi:3-deoxy-7-phosphoheptulonate synthase [soil metagenome]